VLAGSAGVLGAATVPLLLPSAFEFVPLRLIPLSRLTDSVFGCRPADRYEPRVKKRRRNHYGWLTKPRAEMKREMANVHSSNILKDAKLRCGLTIKVPLFIKVGEHVKVDTATHKYSAKESVKR
jgi:hypothetical protein